jgi:hypothetical protein
VQRRSDWPVQSHAELHDPTSSGHASGRGGGLERHWGRIGPLLILTFSPTLRPPLLGQAEDQLSTTTLTKVFVWLVRKSSQRRIHLVRVQR